MRHPIQSQAGMLTQQEREAGLEYKSSGVCFGCGHEVEGKDVLQAVDLAGFGEVWTCGCEE